MSIEELGYLTASAALAAYVLGTAADKCYSLMHNGQHLTPYYPALTLWALPIAVVAQKAFHRRYEIAKEMRKHGCKPANIYPQRDPILGIDVLQRTMKSIKAGRVMQEWHQWYQDHGNAFTTSTLGTTTFFLNDPENIKAILTRDFESFPIKGPRQLTTTMIAGEHNILSLNKQAWHDARALIRPTFVRNQVSDMACMDRHVEHLLNKIPTDGTTVEMQEMFYMLTMDTSTDFMFGQSTNTLTNPTKEALEFMKTFDRSTHGAAKITRTGPLARYLPKTEFNANRKVYVGFVDRYIQEAMARDKTPERSYIFLDELVKSGASPDQIRDQILGLILGGRDTTAGALSMSLWIFARRPDIVKSLRDEIAQLDGKKPKWEQLKNMRYLNFFIKELLRLYPSVGGTGRQAIKDTVLPTGGGLDGKSPLFVPKGSVVRWSMYTLHRRKDTFGPDADEFRPERWDTLRSSWGWIPFSGGPRICIGQQFALTQLSYTIVRILQRFSAIEPRSDEPLKTNYGITLTLDNGCHVAFTPA
ncbi:hypothetical protein jhhlp_004144 [Lomentospora prolificans]|uniref:Uncharacterized protein n=1 Tax=Lomentospora prolificans TaxID=41688 RepID=A0A2N3NAU9_9PEZI|nr:hypothetical protein jhhlp_004144 [Lomentospora prolificans]